MNEEIANRSTLYAAQYAGQGDQMFYMSSIPGYWAAIILIGILLVVGIVVVILDSMTKEPDNTWKEVNYDCRWTKREKDKEN